MAVECGTNKWVDALIPGGALNFFFGMYVPRGFPKVGSRERIFFEKLGVLGTKIWEICLFRAEILAKNKAENAKFF